jgi:hypothetical protein
MTQPTRPPVSPGEDLDGLLRAFYQAQLPHPWPDFKVPGADDAPSARGSGIRRFALARSRLALAASVALLVFGSFFLPRPAPQSADPELKLGSPTATNVRPGGKTSVSVYLEQRQGEPTQIRAVAGELPSEK